MPEEHNTIGDAIVAVSRDNSGWIRSLIQTIVLGGGITAFHYHTTDKIDAGKDEQRAHWQAERHHKDSVDRAFQDTVIYYLKRKH